MLPKWAFSLILFAVAVLGAMVAKLAQRRGARCTSQDLAQKATTCEYKWRGTIPANKFLKLG